MTDLRRVPGVYLFHNGTGSPYSYFTVRDAFRRAAIAAGVVNAQFRDIRAKAATDDQADGKNASALMGHDDPRTTKRYIRKIKVTKAVGRQSIGQ